MCFDVFPSHCDACRCCLSTLVSDSQALLRLFCLDLNIWAASGVGSLSSSQADPGHGQDSLFLQLGLPIRGSYCVPKAMGGLCRGGAGSGSSRNVDFLKRIMHFSHEFQKRKLALFSGFLRP